MVCATARVPRTALGSHREAHVLQELETNIRNSTVVGRAATDATPDDAWENLVRIIQETAGETSDSASGGNLWQKIREGQKGRRKHIKQQPGGT